LAQIEVLLYLVENEPGRSALELAQAIYGAGATELSVQQDLMRLVSSGEIERRGMGSLGCSTEPARSVSQRCFMAALTPSFAVATAAGSVAGCSLFGRV
jgi:hypothetical protein